MKMSSTDMIAKHGGPLRTYAEVCSTLTPEEKKAIREEMHPDIQDVEINYLDLSVIPDMSQGMDNPEVSLHAYLSQCTVADDSDTETDGESEAPVTSFASFSPARGGLGEKVEQKLVPSSMLVDPVRVGWKQANLTMAIVYQFLNKCTRAVHICLSRDNKTTEAKAFQARCRSV